VSTTALITGGAGFIGSNLADALVAEGRTVHVVDSLVGGRRIQVPAEAAFHELDIREAGDLAEVVNLAAPATIFHLAAQVDVRRALDDPAYDADVNIGGTLAVLEAARRVGARVVFASTGGAGYGEYPGLPIPTPETEETRPLSHYGMSKMAGEGYLGLYGRLYGLETVALRLGNVYGPRQDPHGEAGVVAIFCGCILDGKRPKVFGTGLQTRDYVYVGDVARAFLLAESGPAGQVVNVGCGREVSVLDLLAGLGHTDPPELAPPRPGELQRSALDNGKAARIWGWHPEVSLDDGLRITFEAIAESRREPEARPRGAFG
jgi:UDP-glucose 4-epimerase